MNFQNNQSKSRYELHDEGGISIIDYKLNTGKKTIYLIHTEVPQEIRGKNIGTRLVQKTLNDIKTNGWKLIPLCPFVVAYLKRHPEYHSIIHDEKKADFK